MATAVTYANLETQPWTVEIGPTINAVQSTSIRATQVALRSGQTILRMTNEGQTAMAGGMLALKLPLPTIPGVTLAYSGLDLMYRIPSEIDLSQVARLENDVKIVLKPGNGATIPNTYNFSSQLNNSETWMMQVVNSSGNWIDCGYRPTMPAPGTWTALSFRHFLDIANGKFSMLSVSQGADAPYQIPSTLREQPLQPSSWNAVIALQLQTELLRPGALSTDYTGIKFTFSDSPF
jgi:hypothetical protein